MKMRFIAVAAMKLKQYIHIISLTIIILAVALIMICIPSRPTGIRKSENFSCQSVFTGNTVTLCLDMYTSTTPKSTEFWVHENDNVIEKLIADNDGIIVELIGTSKHGYEHYLISFEKSVEPQDCFSLICYGKEKIAGKLFCHYSLRDFSTSLIIDKSQRITKAILFPQVLIDQKGSMPIEIDAGEFYPIIDSDFSSNEILALIFKIYKDSQWGSVSKEGENIRLVSPMGDEFAIEIKESGKIVFVKVDIL